MSNLDTWKALSKFSMVLPSGTHVAGHYIDMETAIMGGGFDFSVLQGLSNDDASKAEADPAVVAEGLRYKRYVVCACLDDIDGEETHLTEDDYALIPEADRTAFFQKAVRAEENEDAPLEAVS